MQKARVTGLAWVAIAISVVAATCVYLSVWAAVYTDGPEDDQWGGQNQSWLTPLVFYVGVSGTLLAIVLNLILGTKGKLDRLVGVVGGLVLLLPIGLAFLGLPIPI